MTTEPETPMPYERYFGGPMWQWFGLSYAGYLVVPRIALCSMPIEWQERMVKLLEEMNKQIRWDGENDYVVGIRKKGRFASDPMSNYKYPPENAITFLGKMS